VTSYRIDRTSRRDEPTAPPPAASARAAARGPAVVAAALLLVACPARAADLDRTTTAAWTGIGLRDWAARASEIAGMPVLVDPRLDPETRITLDCRDEPIRTLLVRAAAAADGELACLRSTARLVPPATAAQLERAEAVRERTLATLPPRQRAILAARRPWIWPAGARPRDLVVGAAAEAGITLEGVDAVPHDHLPASSLPPLSLAERLDLLLAGYGLQVDWAADAGRIVPLARSLPDGAVAADDRRMHPAPPRGGGKSPRKTAAAAEPTFSLEVAAPLDQVLATIAGRLGLEPVIDQASLRRRGIAAGEIVRARVKDATRDQLLDALLEPLELSWRIEDGRLRVFARE
jgi:hypothetical protein